MSSITCPNKSCGAVLEGTDLRHCPKCAAFLPLPVPEEAADPLVGQPILNGKYRILSVIGEGGMGKVYLAEQKLGHATRKVAIKTLQPDLANDPQIIARFHRETQTVIELEHPNTIKFFDFGELEDHGKKLFVVMEFIQGESLAHVLARGPIDLVRAERIMAQMCGSLQEAHDHGVVHRDLKPENIYLTQKGAKGDFVKVLDFGIAKRDEAGAEKDAKLTRQGMVLGTPPYMSPEQFTGQSLDGRSDIYALGVIAYEMLTGALPFTAATPWEWATKHLTATPTPLEQQPNGNRIPERNKKAIMRALGKNRDERPKSVTDFLQEFSGNSDGATDWTASSTSLPTGGSNSSPQPIATNHGPQQQQQQQQGQGGFVTNPTVASAGPFQGQPTPPPGYGTHPANTPSPFMQSQTGPGFVPAPSSAGFQAVPSGMAGSNPGFAHPTGNFAPMPSQYGMAPPPKKSSAGLIVGLVIAAAAVLGGGGFGISQLLLAEDEPAQQQPQNAQQMQMQQMQQMQQQQQMQMQQQQQQQQQAMQAANMQQHPQQPMPTPQPTVQNPAPMPTPQPQPQPNNNNNNNGGGGGSPAVARGMSAVAGNNFSGAISALQDASRDGDSTGASRLRSEIRRRGRNRIDNLILGGNCSAAQALFRMLRGASSAPPADSFGDACPAP